MNVKEGDLIYTKHNFFLPQRGISFYQSVANSTLVNEKQPQFPFKLQITALSPSIDKKQEVSNDFLQLYNLQLKTQTMKIKVNVIVNEL